MEEPDNVITLIFFLVIILMLASIIPAIVGLVASNVKHDETFKSYFNRADASIYFTDAKIIEMRRNYTAEYRCRLRNAFCFIVTWVACVIYLSPLYSNTNHISDNTLSLIGSLMACLYIFGCSYLVGIASASKGRLEATYPLNDWQRENIKNTLVTSTYSKKILQLINSNPKKQLAQIDYLFILHAIREFKEHEVRHVDEHLSKQL